MNVYMYIHLFISGGGGELSTLNKIYDFFTPCLHKQKFKLINQK